MTLNHWLLLLQIILLGIIVPGVRWVWSIRMNDLAHLDTELAKLSQKLDALGEQIQEINHRLSHIEGRLQGGSVP